MGHMCMTDASMTPHDFTLPASLPGPARQSGLDMLVDVFMISIGCTGSTEWTRSAGWCVYDQYRVHRLDGVD